MPQAKSITKRIQAQRTPLIIERDYPNSKLLIDDPDYEEHVCRYCEQRFLKKDPLWRKTWEHLDNNNENQELWNLAWVHWKCNVNKKTDADLQIRARDIIKKNQQWEEQFDFESAREREKISHIDIDEQTETDLNVAHTEITEQFLTEKLSNKNKRYLVSDAIYCIALRCQKQTGHGSAQAVRNYLKILSCVEGDYDTKKIEGKNYIFQRHHDN